MSMIYMIRQVPQSAIDLLQASPLLINQFLTDGTPLPPKRSGFFAWLLGIPPSTHTAISVPSVVFPQDLEECGLEKSWHGLHFLLSGSDWEGEPPEAFLLNWGTEIGTVDVGYGPARSFTPDQTVQIHDGLSGIHPDILRARFDPAVMTQLELYPNCWDRDPEVELQCLLDSYNDLRQFVGTTVDKQLGMVAFIG